MVTKFGSSDVILHNPTASYNLVENLTNYRLLFAIISKYFSIDVWKCKNDVKNICSSWKSQGSRAGESCVTSAGGTFKWQKLLYFLQKVQRRQFSSVGEQVTTWRMAEMQQPAPLLCMSYPSHSTHAPPQQYCCGRCCHFSFKQETKFFSAILSFSWVIKKTAMQYYFKLLCFLPCQVPA